MKEQRFKELFHKYLHENLTGDDEREFYQLWLDPSLENSRAQIIDQLYDGLSDDKDMAEEKADLIFRTITEKQATVLRLPVSSGRVIWRSVAVASAILLGLGLSAYFLVFRKNEQPQEIAQISRQSEIAAPEMNRAMITLDNGQKIYLDSVLNGSLDRQEGVELVKLADGRIAYEGSNGSTEVRHHTLFNPRGSRVVDMTMTDGSRVWLNAGSSITYPVPFTGNERKVSIEGEAYFEVASDARRPFIVSKGETMIRVLGTHFNINAYDDEADIRITLLEGSVQVADRQQASRIKPGEQAIVKQGEITVADKVDLEQVMAWKDGFFRMKGIDLASLMRQISRWYDVEVVYRNGVPKARFGGVITRDVNLSDVLKALEQYGISPKLEEGKIIIQ